MASATGTGRVEPVLRLLRRARGFGARISVRLLAFNVLLVFLPAAGLLTLDTYERQLLRAQERAMVGEGRLLAAALASPDGLDAREADRVLLDLQQRHQARLRVVDLTGQLIADSSRLGPQREAEIPSPYPPLASSEGWLYWAGALPFRVYRRLEQPPKPVLESGEFYSGGDRLLGPEIQAALQGRYGAATRISGGQRSVTLYAAIPIRAGRSVIGAVLVSQSTFGILQALYAVRLDVFRVVLASLAAAAVLSLFMSTTIARPLRRLRAEALAIIDRRGRLQGAFRGSERRDEIGDLARALEQLTDRLQEHMAFVERFASDVSHEFKNPLTSIRTATELLAGVEEPEPRRRFLTIIQREVARMERLLAGVREISRIDAQLSSDAPQSVDVVTLLDSIVDGYRLRPGQPVAFDLDKPAQPLPVRGAPDRLTQIFENLLDNAVSFSPAGGTVRVAIAAEPKGVVVHVCDQGPGIPPEHLDKIFARFFSYRPGQAALNGHAGLGLPIARAIAEAYGGSIAARNQPEGGARFEVHLSSP